MMMTSTAIPIKPTRISRHRISGSLETLEDSIIPEDDSHHHSEEELSSDQSDDEDSTITLLLTKIYVDPLQDVLEKLDSEAGYILQSGKITVTGQPGNMELIQPLLFSLQATESELPLLLPDLMKNPFFLPTTTLNLDVASKNVLSEGHIQIGVSIDKLISHLLSTHCCKSPGSKQAEALIETAFKTLYSPPSSMQRFQQASKNPPPLVPVGYSMEAPVSKSPLRRIKSERKPSYAGIVVNRQKGVSRSIDLIDSPIMNQEPSSWHVHLPRPKDILIASYGENKYPLLLWNSDLKINFQIGSDVSTMSTAPALLNSNQPSLRLHILNNRDVKVAFSIRAYRQSLMFRSHVIYPKEGLHILEPHQEFWKEADIVGSKVQHDEHFIIDLMVCTLDDEPSWNIQRRYGILKFSNNVHDQYRLVRRVSGKDILHPGLLNHSNKELANILTQVMLHGLQSVVKNKLDEAEIIFTQALYLPMFQRVPLKTFAYICLAVVADKRKKRDNENMLSQVIKLVNSFDELIDTCEGRDMLMPKLIMLNKQLRHELNPAKIINDTKGITKQSSRSEVTKCITDQPETLDCQAISLIIPEGTLPVQTNVTLSHMSNSELHQLMQSSPWASMVRVVACFRIDCNPNIETFSKPFVANILLPDDDPIPSPPFRLLQSNYRSVWVDVTDEPSGSITIANGKMTVKTHSTGWLIVAAVTLDMIQISEMAVKSVFSVEPIALQVNVCYNMFSGSAQISVFISPVTKEGWSVTSKSFPPKGHKRISFPRTFRAQKGQKLRLELQGKLEAESNGDLISECTVDNCFEIIIEKTVRLTSESKSLHGKLIISEFCNQHYKWESIQEILISSSSTSYANSY